jgi:hypothetical protein
MTKEEKYIREYCKTRYPVGTLISDWSIHGEYEVKKSSIFEFKRWTKDDYNPQFLPDDEDDYHIDIWVRNRGKNSISYTVEIMCSINDIKFWFEWYERQKVYEKQREDRRRQWELEKEHEIKSKISEVLYKNSSDDSEAMRIKFENVDDVVDSLYKIIES